MSLLNFIANQVAKCWLMIAKADKEASRAACRTAQNVGGELFDVLMNMGHSLALSGHPTEALTWYRKALVRAHGATAQYEQAINTDLSQLAQSRRMEFKAVRHWFDQAWPKWKQSVKLFELVSTAAREGRHSDAISLAEQRLSLVTAIAEPGDQYMDDVEGQLTDVLRAGGQADRALGIAEQRLRRVEERDGAEHFRTSSALYNLALVHLESARFAVGLGLLERSLAIIQRVDPEDHRRIIGRLRLVALAQSALWRPADALSSIKAALEISERRFGPTNQRTNLLITDLALMYLTLGRFEDAKVLLDRSLVISRHAERTAGESTAISISNLAAYHLALRQTETAKKLLRQALTIFESSLGRGHVKSLPAMKNLAIAMLKDGHLAEAEQLLEEVVSISEKTYGGESLLTDFHRVDLALVIGRSGRHEEALARFSRSLLAAETHGVDDLRMLVHIGLMELHRSSQDPRRRAEEARLAIWYGKQAVNRLQTMRASLQVLDRSIQSSFQATVATHYRDLSNLLIESGRISEAEQVLAMLKEREAFVLTRSTGASASTLQASFDGVERAALAEQRRLEVEGVRQSQELFSLERQRKAVGTLPEADEARRQALLVQAQAWRAGYQRFLASLSERFAQTSGPSSVRDADQQSTRLQARVALDTAGAVGLHYVVTDDRIGIIVATPRGSFGRFSAVPRVELERQIVALRQAIFTKADTRPTAQALWKMLIGPVQADIKASGAQTLVLSLTDNLRYLPFAALQDPQGRYLVQDHALALWAAAADVTPSAGKAEWQVTGLGLTEARLGFTALPAVRQELAGIVRTGPADTRGVLPGSIALNEDFTRRRFEAALTGRANVLHVASHFDFRPGDESRSVLLLGQGEPISLGQLAVMDFSEIDQLTLSACDTATGGGVNDDGAEVEGLAAIVLRQRAGAVLATLWKVADESTATLMRDFYAKRTQGQGKSSSLSRAQALRQAQLAMLEGQKILAPGADRGASRVGSAGRPIGAQPADPDRPWAHPYYWAPFVLSGNWL